MTEESESGKRVVAVLLALAVGAALIAWLGASQLEKSNRTRQQTESASVLSEGILYEAHAGNPGIVIAKDVGSGKELWRAELGSVSSRPVVTVNEEVVEVQIAGTPWMTLDRSTGEPKE